jgi:REP element-mobilizing transposase RayT
MNWLSGGREPPERLVAQGLTPPAQTRGNAMITRFWLITSTTYGTWLPGDARGFVSTVKDQDGPRIRHNELGTPYDADVPELQCSARSLLKGTPVYLSAAQAVVVKDQFLETATYRRWRLHATAVMANHFHAVVESPEEVHSTKILADLKSYASRALNCRWQKPASGTWWTESGSRRSLSSEERITDAILYAVTQQHNPLVIWHAQQHSELVNAALSGGHKPPERVAAQGAYAPRSGS